MPSLLAFRRGLTDALLEASLRNISSAQASIGDTRRVVAKESVRWF